MDSTLLTKPEVAKRCGVSLRTVNYWIAQKRIGFVKIGHAIRVLQSDLDDFIQRHRIGTPPRERTRCVGSPIV